MVYRINRNSLYIIPRCVTWQTYSTIRICGISVADPEGTPSFFGRVNFFWFCDFCDVLSSQTTFEYDVLFTDVTAVPPSHWLAVLY
jgi:hypothetical protein